jgi:hypothetical protein
VEINSNLRNNCLFQGEKKGNSFTQFNIEIPWQNLFSLLPKVLPSLFFPKWWLEDGEVYRPSWRQKEGHVPPCPSLQAPVPLAKDNSSPSLGIGLCSPSMCCESVCSWCNLWSALSAWPIYGDSSQGARSSLPVKILPRVLVPWEGHLQNRNNCSSLSGTSTTQN